ncbi:MAG: hypothetical protein PHW13_00430 [Methylococcales bacterium]|nr:hypothetical protein [Methylococcales bacterium]
MQFLAAYIMKGRMQAMIVASTLAILSLLFLPISIVSSATVALVTLRLGSREGLYVLLSGCAAAAVLSLLLFADDHFALMRLVLWFWLPVWLIAISLREGRQLSGSMEIAVLLGVLGVMGFYWLQPDPAAFWRGVLAVVAPLMFQGQPDAAADNLKAFIEMIAYYMTGGFAAASVYMLLFGLLLARWWQAGLYNPGGFRTEFLGLKGHSYLAVATLLVTALIWLSGGELAEMSANVLIVLCVFYTFIGTAVLHCSFANMKGSRFTVPFLYFTLFTIPHVLVLVALCGLCDTWLDLRNKLKPNGA